MWGRVPGSRKKCLVLLLVFFFLRARGLDSLSIPLVNNVNDNSIKMSKIAYRAIIKFQALNLGLANRQNVKSIA
jgi:hypothetical protein